MHIVVVDDNRKWPSVEFGSVYVYLIDTPGPFNRENMQAYKSLDAYEFFADGWVHTCYMRISRTGYCIIKGKVNRSQALTDKPRDAWVALKMKDGTVECGHCTCMAGLGEVCSHMAAILFKVEANTRLGYNEVSCTSVPCAWNQTYTKKVEGVPLTEINFDLPHRVLKQESRLIYDRPTQKELKIDDPTDLLNSLRQSSPNAVIFTVTYPKRPVARDPKLPLNMISLYSIKNSALETEKLIELCEETFRCLTVTKEQPENLEKSTRNQSKSGLWHQFRAGRLTTSLFYDITRTDPNNPSKSLLKKILNYDIPFSNAATTWGLSNEDTAIKQYIDIVGEKHVNFSVVKSGFIINQDYPHLGSSPDSIVKCDCCGVGTVEVKSPYKFRENDPCAINDCSFFLTQHRKADIHVMYKTSLKKDQKFYYQVQGQMGIGKFRYGDFICCTSVGIHMERIQFDDVFFGNIVKNLLHSTKSVFCQNYKHRL